MFALYSVGTPLEAGILANEGHAYNKLCNTVIHRCTDEQCLCLITTISTSLPASA